MRGRSGPGLSRRRAVATPLTPYRAPPVRSYYCADMESHYVETWHAMEDLVEEGLVKSAGVSNFNIAQLREVLESVKKHKPAVLQNECHPYLQQKDMVDFCKLNGIGACAAAVV